MGSLLSHRRHSDPSSLLAAAARHGALGDHDGRPIALWGAALPPARWSRRGASRTNPMPLDAVPEGLSQKLYELFSKSPHVLDSIWGVVTDALCLKVEESATRVRAPLLFIHARGDRLVKTRYAKGLARSEHLGSDAPVRGGRGRAYGARAAP